MNLSVSQSLTQVNEISNVIMQGEVGVYWENEQIFGS